MKIFDKVLLTGVIVASLLVFNQAKANEAFELRLPIICGPSEPLLTNLKNTYNEQMIFMSPSENEVGETLTHSFWLNLESQTWSFIVTNKERKTTCVISSGDTFVLMQPQGVET